MPDNEQPEAEQEETPTAPEVQPDLPEVETDDDDDGYDWKAEAKKLRKKDKEKRLKLEAYEEEERKRKADEAKREEEKKKDEGKYKELLSEKEQELLTYQEKASRYDELESSLREDYLSKLPKKHREKYESVDIEILKGIVEDFVGQPTGSSVVDEASRRRAEPTDWFTLTTAEQQQLLSDDPAKASQLMREAGRKNQKTYR